MRFLALLLLCTSTLALHSSLCKQTLYSLSKPISVLCNIPFFSWTRTEVKPKQTSPPPQPILKAADHSIEAPVDPDPTEEPLDPTRSEEPVGWIPYNGNLYYLNNDRMDWLAALIWCFEQDSTLVSILSVEENFVVNDIVVSKLGSLCEEKKSKDQCRIIWSGAYREKNLNEYAWSDQSEWTYANKVENETNLNFEKPVCLKVCLEL
ncbi:hypothetical protein L596_015283 [Steinernema carpocapsae]|uniref:C-type lectin domain-containing protein n=1 Tax=Steinernema carpocapsae TaxID=34508 RepID=A0A4U5NFJ1_STECR|nr:hypothetical protein L596_015283 [Steinernema carpocapsae]